MNVLRPICDHIPNELKTRKQWVCWLLKKIESPNGKPPKKPFTKIPICPNTGKNASTTEPITWTDFGIAWDYYEAFAENGSIHGLGFILRDDLIGVDLDGCRDANTGKIADWAQKIIDLLNSYTEISPSGTGIRIFCKGEPQPKGSNRRKGDIEIYDHNSPRYLTVTGWHLEGTPREIENRCEELERLYEQVFGKIDQKPLEELAIHPAPSSVKKILDVAMAAKNGGKFAKLWEGEWEGDYPSQSQADLSLCSMLAFYCGNDPEKIDLAFRESKLYRDKWERDDYRERTIEKALSGCTEFYRWGMPQEQVAEALSAVGSHAGQNAIADLAQAVQERHVAEKQKKTAAYEFLTFPELSKLPPLQWLVEDHFPEKSINEIWGESGSGKSFYALDVALSVAHGINFLGQFKTVKSSVLYIASEGWDGIFKRGKAWEQAHGLALPDNILICPNAVNLPEEWESFIKAVKVKFGGYPRLLIIDTLNWNFGNGDENSTKDMTRFTHAIREINALTGATIIIIHHSGKDISKGSRGAYSLKCALNAEIYIEGNGVPLTSCKVMCKKQKDAPAFKTYHLLAKHYEVGDKYGSLALEPMDNVENDWQTLRQENLKLSQFLQDLTATYGNGSFTQSQVVEDLTALRNRADGVIVYGTARNAVGDYLKQLEAAGMLWKEGSQGKGGFSYSVNPQIRGLITAKIMS
jgi:hypothetical protein